MTAEPPPATPQRPRQLPAPTHRTAWIARIAQAPRSCCCEGKPAAVAILLPGPGRPEPVDLMLCDFHYHQSQAQLATAGAIIHTAFRL